MNAIAPLSQPAAQIHDGASKVGQAVLKSDLPETVAGTLREYTKFTPGQQLEIEGVKFRVHDVTEQRLVLKFVYKQR